jgi:hypothetical protein
LAAALAAVARRRAASEIGRVPVTCAIERSLFIKHF